jgi:peptidoglycan/LPS O-acetylase OafA/YrhL
MQITNLLRNSLTPPLLKHSYNRNVEQYRGLCAVLVLLAHGTTHDGILLKNFELPEYLHYVNAGYLSVLIFFCISGYVIGLTNDNAVINALQYIKKRAVRLYPAYIISIIICLFIASGISARTLVINFFFLQNVHGYFGLKAPIFLNFSTWSLNYEAVYYSLFLVIFWLKPKTWPFLSCLFLASVLMINITTDYIFIANYLNGFYFWLLGLLISWRIILKKDVPRGNQDIPLLSILFLHLCQNHLGLGKIALNFLSIESNTNFNWLMDIPFCLMVMATLTQRENKLTKINKIFCYIAPAAIFIYLIMHHRLFEHERWIMCFIFWIMSLIFYFETVISKYLLSSFTVIGEISYALYLLHVPIALFIKNTVHIHNPITEFIVKYSLWITITFTLSYIIEKKLQPAIKRYTAS